MRYLTLKRILAVLLLMCSLFSFVSCDNGTDKNPVSSTMSSESSVADDDTNVISKDENSSQNSSKHKETIVYDSQTVEESIVVDDPRPLNTYKNEWGVYEMLKCYTNSSSKVTEEQFLSSVGYLQAGNILDTMFDTFVFLPSPSEEIGVEMDQKYILNYINNVLYKPDYNINALENATKTVKKALNKEDYKVNVFLPLFRPLETVTDFGEYNGNNIDCSTEEGRLEALKWFIDTHISVFKSKNFENINLVGFYWFDEFANAENYSLIQNMNDYIHSKDYITVWSPYYNAAGYSDWKKLKFDIATMQSNYFPGNPDGLNAGGIGRLSSNAINTERSGMGMELEALGFKTNDGIRGFKETMQSMLLNGRIDFVHMYYIDYGPICVDQWYKFKTKYGQSVYHELYRFIKRTLESEDISFQLVGD